MVLAGTSPSLKRGAHIVSSPVFLPLLKFDPFLSFKPTSPQTLLHARVPILLRETSLPTGRPCAGFTVAAYFLSPPSRRFQPVTFELFCSLLKGTGDSSSALALALNWRLQPFPSPWIILISVFWSPLKSFSSMNPVSLSIFFKSFHKRCLLGHSPYYPTSDLFSLALIEETNPVRPHSSPLFCP